MSKAELKETAVAVLRVFVFAAVPVFAASVSGVGAAPNLAVAKSLAVAAVLGAAAAGVRAVYGAFRAGQLPFPKVGV